MKNGNGNGNFLASSVRANGAPPLSRKVWILGSHPDRTKTAVDAIHLAGHEARVGELGAELAPALREFKPDMIVIDMQDQPDRNRHLAVQLRADRATRQLPIILVGLQGEEAQKADRAVPGPTRRYVHSLDTPSVLNSLVVEL